VVLAMHTLINNVNIFKAKMHQLLLAGKASHFGVTLLQNVPAVLRSRDVHTLHDMPSAGQQPRMTWHVTWQLTWGSMGWRNFCVRSNVLR
jgi:hypothetical protein